MVGISLKYQRIAGYRSRLSKHISELIQRTEIQAGIYTSIDLYIQCENNGKRYLWFNCMIWRILVGFTNFTLYDSHLRWDDSVLWISKLFSMETWYLWIGWGMLAFFKLFRFFILKNTFRSVSRQVVPFFTNHERTN